MPFSLLAPSIEPSSVTDLFSLGQALGSIEAMLDEGKPIGIIYLDIAKYGHVEGSYGQETFNEIVAVTADVLQSFSGKLFRKEDRLLISEELGDVFIIIFSTTRSEANISPEVMQGIAQNIQDSLNEEIKTKFKDLIHQKVGYFAGHTVLFPDQRVHPRRQIFRAIKEAARVSLGKEQDDLEKKVESLRATLRGNNLTSYFQPIVTFSPFGVMGHELLTRGPGGSRLMDAELMFQVAQRGGLAIELERAARNTAVKTLHGQKYPGKLFLNNGPQVILSPDFADLLIYGRLGWDPSKIVIEITEGEAIKNVREIKEKLDIFRKEGCMVAVDDLSKGNSGLYLLTELKPDYAKVDMTLVRGIDRDELKQRLLQKLLEFAQTAGTKFIAEGIETADEYATLKRLGIEYGQGFYFGVPSPKFVESVDTGKLH